MIVKKTTLSKFFEKQIEEFEDNVLIMDGHNLVYRNLYVADYACEEGDKNFLYWKFLMIQSILTSIRKYQPKKVILAFDHPYCWRKKFYPDYKAHRKALRDKSTIDFKAFFPILEQFIIDLRVAFPNIYILKIDECEADDILAICIKEIYKKNKAVIISCDKDIRQLLKYKNVELFDPIKKTNIKALNPIEDLNIKVLAGDKQSDNIPPIRRGLGKKTAAKLIRSNTLDVFLEKNNLMDEYHRNNMLINFDCIPKEITERVVKEINSYVISKYSEKKAWEFMIKNQIRKFIDELQFYKPYLEILS